MTRNNFLISWKRLLLFNFPPFIILCYLNQLDNLRFIYSSQHSLRGFWGDMDGSDCCMQDWRVGNQGLIPRGRGELTPEWLSVQDPSRYCLTIQPQEGPSLGLLEPGEGTSHIRKNISWKLCQTKWADRWEPIRCGDPWQVNIQIAWEAVVYNGVSGVP